MSSLGMTDGAKLGMRFGRSDDVDGELRIRFSAR